MKYIFIKYVLVIVQFPVQYDQHVPSFSYFAELQITAKYKKRGKYWPYCAR